MRREGECVGRVLTWGHCKYYIWLHISINLMRCRKSFAFCAYSSSVSITVYPHLWGNSTYKTDHLTLLQPVSTFYEICPFIPPPNKNVEYIFTATCNIPFDHTMAYFRIVNPPKVIFPCNRACLERPPPCYWVLLLIYLFIR